jgi:integrase/recombinase XerC
MPSLSPPPLTQGEQRAILRATGENPRDHLIYSLALGTGLRLAEIVGLNIGDLYTTDGKPRSRFRLRPDIAKG